MRPMSRPPPARGDVEPLLATIVARLPATVGIWLFGSLAAGRPRPDSDIDLAVLGREPFDRVQVFDLGLDLGVQAGRDVDLVDLRRVSTVMRKEIVTEGVLVHCTDAAACEAFVAEARALYVARKEEQRFVLEPARARRSSDGRE